MNITFIQTGGTIDKDYPRSSKGWAFEFGEPAVIRILEKLNPSFNFKILMSCQKDSLEINDEDRNNLVDLINNTPENKIIITHGSDSILETATFINNKIQNKVIVLTGAMRPERFTNSEAPINVGCAIGAINVLDEGTYVAMHGIVKPIAEMKRNSKTGKFY